MTPGLLMQFIPNKISEEKNSIINASIMEAMASLCAFEDFPRGNSNRSVMTRIALLI